MSSENMTSDGSSIQSFLMAARAIQYVFLAIFAYGIAWTTSDIVTVFQIPVTGWAIGSVVFGALGILASELQIRRLESQIIKP